MFKALEKKIASIQNLSEDDLMRHLYQNEGLKEQIIYLNTYGQLYNEGIDSEGNSLGSYSPYTMQLKATNNYGGDTRIDHITLKDTGAFYNSFRIYLTPDFDLLIYSEPIKEDTNLLEDFGADIIGLTEENMDKIRVMVKQIALAYVRYNLK